jgi:hypothetical protein
MSENGIVCVGCLFSSGFNLSFRLSCSVSPVVRHISLYEFVLWMFLLCSHFFGWLSPDAFSMTPMV